MIGNYTYVDIGIVAVLFIFFVSGLKKGLIDTVLGLVGGLVSLVIAVLLAGTVADIIFPVFGIGDSINGSVQTFLTNLLNPENNPSNQFAVPIGSEQNISELVTAAIGQLGLPAQFTQSISAAIATSISNAIAGSDAAIITQKSLIEILSPVLGRIILLVISVILVFIVIRIAVAIIESITKAILSASSSLRGLNRLLGGIVGIVQGGLVVIIIFTVGFFLLSGTSPDPESGDLKTQIRTNIEISVIGKMVYDNNPVPKYITDHVNLDNILGSIGNLFGGNNNPDPNPSATPDVSPDVTPAPSPDNG